MKRLAVALGLVALVAGCDGCSDETKKAPPQPTAIPAVPAPAGLLLVARASRPVATWTRLRSLTRGSALFLPRSVGGLVSSLYGLPITTASDVDERIPIVAAARRPDDSKGPVEVAVAVHVRNGERMVAALVSPAGGKPAFSSKRDDGVTWLTATDGTSGALPTRAVIDNYLIAGTSKTAIQKLGPYLARSVGPMKPAPHDLVAEVPDGALDAALTKRVEALVARAAKGVPAELSAFVDVDMATRTLRDVLAHAKAAQIEIDLADDWLRIDAHADARDAKADAAMKARPKGDPAAFAALPGDVLGALLVTGTAEERRAAAQPRAKGLAQMLEADAGALAKAMRGEASGRGDRLTIGVRCNGVGITGFAHGDVADEAALSTALGELGALRENPKVVAELDKRGIALATKKTRLLRIPHDVHRFILSAKGKKNSTETIDLMYTVAPKRFLVAGGAEAAPTLQWLFKPDPERAWGKRDAIHAALKRLPHEAWLALALDAQAAWACKAGRPGGAVAAPILIGAGPAERGAWFRFHMASPLLKPLVAEFGP